MGWWEGMVGRDGGSNKIIVPFVAQLFTSYDTSVFTDLQPTVVLLFADESLRSSIHP